jgi:small subunit ribosomal protein S1
MSWSKRITNPVEVVNIGDEVEVVILNVNAEKQEISLGMKQASVNPWDIVEEKYPIGSKVKGTIKHLTNYGAFIEIEEGLEGLLHVSDMSWTRKISHPKEVVQEGQPIEAIVLSIDKEKKRIAIGLKQMIEDPWDEYIPGKYLIGSHYRATVSKITNFGLFVALEPTLEGLLHVSELGFDETASHDAIEKVVKPGNKLDVRVIRVDPKERKIGLALSVPIEEQKLEGDEGVITEGLITSDALDYESANEQESTQNKGLGSALAQAIEASKEARGDYSEKEETEETEEKEKK